MIWKPQDIFILGKKENKVEGWAVHMEAELDEWVCIQSSKFASYIGKKNNEVLQKLSYTSMCKYSF